MTKMNVVIPVYNQAYALSLTLHGLTRQAAPYNRCPVIVVDDGSEEPVHAVAEAYRGRLNLTYVRIPRSGRAAARNAGARLLDEGCVLFCDADRIPRPRFIEAHEQAWRKHGGHFAVGQVRELYVPDAEQNRDLVLARYEAQKYDRIPQYCRLVYRLFNESGSTVSPVPWIAALSGNMSLPLDLFRDLGGFDDTFREWGFEHLELGYRAHRRQIPFAYCREAVNVHLAHPRTGVTYADFIRRSHDTFFRKHPHPVIGAFYDFMMGRISRIQLENLASTGMLGSAGRNTPDEYVKILNFKA
ncbi:glycosyltransferase family 2 protein [Paenibacillus sp. GbtcB18]|uniref:glycosyltransferase family 2 protein n=1 Tax=Paenibacillus sp. GbtcB18 TaxID=2824763 RepID=UPI001C31197D|nr:glycosyltransferase [Paenibacillus sp. GbtcB18]